jgi:hypothetical protein
MRIPQNLSLQAALLAVFWHYANDESQHYPHLGRIAAGACDEEELAAFDPDDVRTDFANAIEQTVEDLNLAEPTDDTRAEWTGEIMDLVLGTRVWAGLGQYLTDTTDRHLPDAVELKPWTPKPARCVIVMDGGLVQSVLADVPLDVVKIDYDTDGCTLEDGIVELTDVDEDTGLERESESTAFISEIGSDLAPEYVAARFRQCEQFADDVP